MSFSFYQNVVKGSFFKRKCQFTFLFVLNKTVKNFKLWSGGCKKDGDKVSGGFKKDRDTRINIIKMQDVKFEVGELGGCRRMMK